MFCFRVNKSSYVSYRRTLYQGALQYIANWRSTTIKGTKHKPTMASAASPRADNPKMMEPPASMAHVYSSYACAEDRYFKRPDKMSIDGDIRSDSGWFFVCFGVGGRFSRN